MTSGLPGRKASPQRRTPAMSDRLVGSAQLVSAAILGSAHPGPTSTDHNHRWSLAVSQCRLPAVHLHGATAWDGGPSCATDTACGPHLAPAGSRLQRDDLGDDHPDCRRAHGAGGRPGERLAVRLGFGKWIVEGTSFRLPDEVRYIQRQAANHDSRIVTIGQLVLFSTDTGDAWLLDRSDQLAARLASRWRDRTDPYRGNRYCIHCQLEGPLSY